MCVPPLFFNLNFCMICRFPYNFVLSIRYMSIDLVLELLAPVPVVVFFFDAATFFTRICVSENRCDALLQR